MGCDIHMYVEYRNKPKDTIPKQQKWCNFGGKINPGRRYDIFSKLAGVRGEGPEPKGLPSDIGWITLAGNILFVTEMGEDNSATPEKAQDWVNRGMSVYTSEDKSVITHPDWHSHSWATIEELENVVEGMEAIEYNAIIAAMKSLESQGMEVRVVYWFDN